MKLSTMTKMLLYLIISLSVILSVTAYFTVIIALMFIIYENKSYKLVAQLKSNIPLCVLSICLLISTLFSQDRIFSIAADIVILLNIMYFLILTAEIKHNWHEEIFKVFSITCLIVCIIGIYQFLSGSASGISSWVDQNTFGALTRIYSTLQNPNIYAEYIVITLCFFLPKYLFKNQNKSMLLRIDIILLSISLILTYSRGGFLAFCIAMGILFILKPDKRIIVYVVIMIIIFYMYNSLGSLNRAALDSLSRDSSSLYRIEIWKAAYKIFSQHPVFGHGVGTMWYYLSGYSDKLSKYVIHAHNIYLHIAAEMGIAGLLSFLYFIASELYTALRIWYINKNTPDSYIIAGFISSMFAVLSHGMIDAVIFIPSLSLIFISYFSLYKAVSFKYTENESNKLSHSFFSKYNKTIQS